MSSPASSPSPAVGSKGDSSPSSPARGIGSPRPSHTITMTPRTKIRTMLMDLDDSGSEFSRTPTKTATRLETPKPGLEVSGGTTVGAKMDTTGATGQEETDEEEDEPIIPRGRIAARIQAQQQGGPARRVNSLSSDGGVDAYERVKKLLGAEQKDISEERRSQKTPNSDSDLDSSNPQPPRRRLLTKKKQKLGSTASDHASTLSAHESSGTSSVSRSQPSRAESTQMRRTHLTKKKARSVVQSESVVPSSRQSSPGLFVSPDHSSTKQREIAVGNSSDSEHSPPANTAFLALVAKKRRERQDREAAEQKTKAERAARLSSLESKNQLLQSSDEGSDLDTAGTRLTQQARPTRKAGKKALEEMNRETQRMSRNMQLAHQARTKKKITKESFFARFNFGLQAVPVKPQSSPAMDPHVSTTASSAPPSDAEGSRGRDTPPTSPLVADAEVDKNAVTDFTMLDPGFSAMDDSENWPLFKDILGQPASGVDKGKQMVAEERPETSGAHHAENASRPILRPVRVRIPVPMPSMNSEFDISDDDLQILGAAKKKSRAIELLDRLPSKRTKEDRTMLILRSLAQLTSPGRNGPKNKTSISSAEMQASLRSRARQQAAEERAEKIQELKNRGIVIQTAEERERDQQEVEDLLEKARQEAVDIGKKEKQAAKNQQEGGMGVSGDEDEDYAGSDEISGSEDENEGKGEDELDEDDEESTDSMDENDTSELVDQEAEEDGDSKLGEDENLEEENNFINDNVNEDDEINDESKLESGPAPRRSRVARVISDDEDDEESDKDRKEMQKPESALSFLRNTLSGLPVSDDAPLGLTQAFAATMADSQSQEMAGEEEQDSLAILRQMPQPEFPSFRMIGVDSQGVVLDSQEPGETQAGDLVLEYSQPQKDSTIPESPFLDTSTQYSIPDPTQDAGFVMSPLAVRRPPPSTVETVMLPSMDESPAIRKKGRLRRRAEVTPATSDQEESAQEPETRFEIDASAFDVMRRGAKKAAQKETFDKFKSDAKAMVEEVAEESEDEYAGLGGASDESAGEENEDDRKMINDDGNEKLEEQKLAALYADNERALDEAAVNKLYKDIATGAFRRKRGRAGSDLDLSSDEDREAQRRAKRREFAKMRQAMFADEKLSKIADDKKKAPFLRAIEDRDDDEDLIDLEIGEESTEDPHSQPQAEGNIPPSQNFGEDGTEASASAPSDTVNSLKRTRPLEPATTNSQNRLPPYLRRTELSKSGRPSTLAEIRATVSLLVEEPDSRRSFSRPEASSDIEHSGDEDEERIPDTYEENAENEEDGDLDIVSDDKPFVRPPFPARRTASLPQPQNKSKTEIVDRLSLLRQRTSSLTSTTSRVAFHNSASASTSSFVVPTLLRRATTNSSLNSASSSGTNTPVTNSSGGFGTERSASDDAKTKKITVGNGGKKASVNFYRDSRLKERERELKGRIGKKSKGKNISSLGGGREMLGILGKRSSWE